MRRIYTQQKFVLHDGISGGVFNTDYNSSGSTYSAWEKQLSSNQKVLDLVLQRMRSDFESMAPKMRKPWNLPQLDSCFNMFQCQNWYYNHGSSWKSWTCPDWHLGKSSPHLRCVLGITAEVQGVSTSEPFYQCPIRTHGNVSCQNRAFRIRTLMKRNGLCAGLGSWTVTLTVTCFPYCRILHPHATSPRLTCSLPTSRSFKPRPFCLPKKTVRPPSASGWRGQAAEGSRASRYQTCRLGQDLKEKRISQLSIPWLYLGHQQETSRNITFGYLAFMFYLEARATATWDYLEPNRAPNSIWPAETQAVGKQFWNLCWSTGIWWELFLKGKGTALQLVSKKHWNTWGILLPC